MPKATSKGSDLPLIPAGIYHAVCYSIIDLGTQQSQMHGPKHQVMITWELPNETFDFDDNGKKVTKPRVIGKTYTLSVGKKANLRRDLESWRGKPFTPEEAGGFEVGVLAGVNCQVNIVHAPNRDGSRTYANINSIVPLGKGMTKLMPFNPIMIYDIPVNGPITFPKDMPEWIVTKIKGSEEYTASVNPHQSQPVSRNNRNTDTDESLQAFPVVDGQDDSSDIPF